MAGKKEGGYFSGITDAYLSGSGRRVADAYLGKRPKPKSKPKPKPGKKK